MAARRPRPADVLAGQGAPPDPGLPLLPPLPIAAIRPLPDDGMAGRAARRVWSSAGWAVRLGWFRVCVRTGVACMPVALGCVCKCESVSVWNVLSESCVIDA